MLIALFFSIRKLDLLNCIKLSSNFVIGIIMQQLNVLPVNVSKNVEIKDDIAATAPSSSKDNFSQHIDLHLTKNKQVSEDKSKAIHENVDAEVVETPKEFSKTKMDSKDVEKEPSSQNSTDEVGNAKEAQDIAASGKGDDKVATTTELESDNQTLNESEQLMSFLTKVDNTLTDNNSSVAIKFSDMSDEQRAKHEAQLLMKSSNLVAELSGVAKAINSGTEDEALVQEKVVKTLPSDNQSIKDEAKVKQLNSALLNETNSSNEIENAAESLLNESSDELDKNNSLIQQININKAGLKESTDEKLESNKVLNVGQNNTHKVDGEESKILNKELSDNSKVANQKNQSELTKQQLMQEKNNLNASDLKESSKTTDGSRVVNDVKNPFELDSKINEQISKIIDNEKGLKKVDANLSSVMSSSQDSNTLKADKGVTSNSLDQILAQESNESDIQLNDKSAEKLAEQSKVLSDSNNKESNIQPTPKPHSNVAFNTSFAEQNSKATQAAYDRVDQQSAEMLSPMGSSEISLNQKSNIQLHHETISIFRKDFSDAVKDKVMLMISQKLQQFDITLDPPELGNMQVRVNLQGEQATVNFVVQNQQAKESLEQNMHKLKELLAEQGVDVGDANVEQQSQQDDQNESTKEKQSNLLSNTAEASDVVEHNLSARVIDSANKVVDYYA